jgi:N-acetylglutamate synthase-like GNAT family acetyltransferase
MTPKQAEQVAQLLNSRNHLQVEYTAEKVSQHADDYLFELRDEVVVACVEVKKVQWYQWEICHLSVSENHERQGLGTLLIRVGNEASEQAFQRSGYREACRFFNVATDNHVAVWQKVLSTNKRAP